MIRALAVFALLLFGLTAGAAARVELSHEAAHSLSPVAAGEFHHHGHEGRVLDVHDKERSQTESHGEGDVSGHVHGASAGADIADRASERSVISPFLEPAPHLAGSTPALPTLTSAPHERPPRTA